MKRVVFLLLIVAGLGYPVISAAVWSYKGPTGAVAESMSCSVEDADTVWVGTKGGIYQTTDAGNTWTYKGLRAKQVRALADTGQCGFGILAGGFNNLYNSLDGGATWNLLESFSADVRSLALTAACQGFVGTGDGVYNSAGVQGLAGVGVDFLAVDSNANVYAVSEDGVALYKTTDGGANWAALAHNLPDGEISALLVDDADRLFVGMIFGGIYVSTNGGTNWTAGNSGLPKLLDNYFVTALGRDRQGNLFAGVLTALTPLRGRIYKSTDNGASWQATANEMGGLYMEEPALCATADNTLYAGAQHGLFKTGDGGAHWLDLSAQISVVPFSSSAFAAAAAGPLFIGSDGDSVYKSTDAGESWSLTGPNNPVGCFSLLALDGTLLCSEDEGPGGVYRSTDNGATWSAANAGLPGEDFNGLTVYDGGRLAADGAGTVYFGLEDILQVYKSGNGGLSWSATAAFPLAESETLLAITGGPGQTVYVGTNKGVYKSTDAGANWVQKTNGLPDDFGVKDDALFIDNVTGAIYAGFWSGLYRSTDGGEHWSLVPVPFPEECGGADQVTTDANGTLYAIICRSQVHLSLDQGATWHDYSAGLPAGAAVAETDQVQLARIYADGSGNLLLSAASGGIYKTAVFTYEGNVQAQVKYRRYAAGYQLKFVVAGDDLENVTGVEVDGPPAAGLSDFPLAYEAGSGPADDSWQGLYPGTGSYIPAVTSGDYTFSFTGAIIPPVTANFAPGLSRLDIPVVEAAIYPEISWNQVSGATTYYVDIYDATGSQLVYQGENNPTDQLQLDIAVLLADEPSGDYLFQVVAVDALGNKSSTELVGVTKPFNPVDFNQDGQVLDEAIVILRMLAGLDPGPGRLGTASDINGDGRLGLAEVEYALQVAAGLRH